MRLQKLEIKGFKSFANETTVHFHENVTGVVGPNGSGKSNIVDAFRWVLGEQKSKDLRLDKMSSVIFNGTSKKKESALAQVSLTFDNNKGILPSEYNSITITRMLYRNGDSEYRINDVTCRLKDITTLLLDTGMGSDSYAIIALNMVDDLLADKENSRQRMLFQASGITKYKVRKEETLRKLKSTEDDLDRVKDLLFEIETNIKSLEKQAKRAEKFFTIKDAYKDQSLKLAIHQVSRTKAQFKQLSQQIEKEEDNYRAAEVSSRTLEAKLEQTKKSNLDKEKFLTEKQKETNELLSRIRSLENEKNILKERINFISLNAGNLSESLANTEFRLDKLAREKADFQNQIDIATQDEQLKKQMLDEALQYLESIRSEHSLMKSDLDKSMQAIQELNKNIFELEKKSAILDNQRESLQTDIARNEAALRERKSEMKSSIDRLDTVKKSAENKEKLIHELINNQELIKAKEENLKTELEENSKILSTLNRILDAKRNEYKLTLSIIENLEGFPESIKFLASNKDWAKNVPLLSDTIYCQEEYRIALENFLEPYLNYYVVENVAEALKAVEMLRKAQKGKANFILLDNIPKVKKAVPPHDDFISAIECVEVEDKYKNMFAYLLDKVFIVGEEKSYEDLKDTDVTLLSSNGAFIRRKFALSGGSVGLFEGKKIGRKKNLEILEKDITKKEKEEQALIHKIQNLREELEKLKNEDLQARINVEKDELNKINQDKITLESKLENFNSYKKETSEKILFAGEKLTQLHEEYKNNLELLNSKSLDSTALKEHFDKQDSTFKEAATKMSDASGKFNEQNIEYIKQQNKLSTLVRELSYRDAQTLELSNQKQQLTNQQSTELKEIETAHKQLASIDKNLQTWYADKSTRETSLTTAETEYFKTRGILNELEEQLRAANRQRQDLQLLINNLKDKFNDVKFQLSVVGERLQIEFKTGINEIINKEPDPNEDVEALEAEVIKLKSRIETFGEVNPLAVEAFNEMSERYQTIKQQEQDIIAAKESLLDTITEIENTATKQYLESFDQIRTNFIEVFRSLFTADDTCDLILANPTNPLESEINIIAKPKGKRPQTINQLSGGEKTLTAIALLFALYLLKPAPFCIFDEVDAPLDDSNIEKFNKIIKKFSTDSQFIIVTHNKATMAAVDVIYGVFMPEQGVSAVSAVDFRSLDHNLVLETN